MLLLSLEELLVGDLIALEIGGIVPADGVLIRGEFACDESNITGETEPVVKTLTNPFVISGTSVTDGQGYIIVCAVGENSVIGREKMLILKSVSNE